MSEQGTPRVDRLAILALSVEFVFFGSLHFTFHGETMKQIPFGSDELKSFLVVFTGMLEVTTGILILLPKTRKWAALVSFILLISFLPSIYKMLVDDTAISGSDAWRDFCRVILVPNHVFLALCAIHLWFSKDTSPGPAEVLESCIPPGRDSTSRAATFIVACVMLFANLAGFLVILASPWDPTTADLWAMMCLAAGALVGFLFGVPRINSERTQSRTHSPNSNIMVVSDWLTKIIVGVGLIEIREIGEFLSDLSAALGKSLLPKPGPQTEVEPESFALALIVYFFLAGIIQGYLLTRMYIAPKLEELEGPGSGGDESSTDGGESATADSGLASPPVPFHGLGRPSASTHRS